MNIIDSQNSVFKDILKIFPEEYIDILTSIVFKINKDTDSYNLRDDLYLSKYTAYGLEPKEKELEDYLKQLQNVKTKHQNKEYNWVIINEERINTISSRFYIAPNPNNIHEIVRLLVEEFRNQNVPVKFKYQLTTNMEQCDRIIIYSDYQNKDRVDQVIKTVYQNNKELFKDCERALTWFYETSTPNVFYAPETPNKAYSTRVAESLIEAKETFNYLYGITDENSKINLNGKDAQEALAYMKMIITSILLRNGLLISKTNQIITLKDKNLNSSYDYKTGILKRFNTDEFGYTEVKFLPTKQGKIALLKNFYSISNIYRQEGIEKRHLPLDERKEEIDRALYPHKYETAQVKK